MTLDLRSALALALILPVLAACGSDAPTPPAAAPQSTTHLRDADLPDAVGVLEAKKADAGAEIAVFGRVRQVADGVFQLVDDQDVQYCGQGEGCMDDCKTPWDYCCENPARVTAATLVVEAKNASGGAVGKAATGLRPLDLVAVKGTIQREEDGTVVLTATDGWFRRERPPVSPDIRFP